MPGRRAFMAGTLAASLPLHAAKLPPPKVGAVRWPGPGYDLHGYIAVPAKAHGKQAAVLVLPDQAGADAFTLGLTDALALAGFVACIPKAVASLDEAVATVRWLGSNAYATGKVAAVGNGWSGGIIERMVARADPLLSCGVIFGRQESLDASIPILSLPRLATATDSETYTAIWQQALVFLRQHLQPQRSS